MAATAPVLGSVDVAAARVAGMHALYGESIYRYCRKRLRSHEDAEDAAQIVFLNAHRALAQGVEPRSDSAWLFKIAENVVLYRHRTSVRRARLEYPADTADLHEIGQPAAEMPGVARDLAEALSRVPPSQQRAFVLREWQGLPYQAIAAELEVSVEAATALVVRARNNLSRELERPSRLRRVGGAAITWLVAPLERIISSGVVIKTAAGVATVVVGLPAATAVIERHAAESSRPVSSQSAVRHTGKAQRSGSARAGSTERPGSTERQRVFAAPLGHVIRSAHVRVARRADVGGSVEGATPAAAAAAPDSDAAPADSETPTGDAAAAVAPSGGADQAPASTPADQGTPAADQGSSGTPPPDQGGTGRPAKRPTLPPKAKGAPPADPGSASSIPHSGDGVNAS